MPQTHLDDFRITKFVHACVRIEHRGTVIVIDPGKYAADIEGLEDADAVLVTHEHADHYLPEYLDALDAPVFTIEAVAGHLQVDAPEVFERTTVVRPGQRFEAAGIPITVQGELHEVIHPDLPRLHNAGFLIDLSGTKVFHPGDALTGADEPVDILLLPVSAPWGAARDFIDFARSVGAPRNVAIHDRVASAAGGAYFDGLMHQLLPKEQSYVRLAEGEDLR